MIFSLKAPYKAAGDQPKAIEEISHALAQGQKEATLLGVTGSGKTYTMAGIIEKIQKPALVLCHNKTLAAQLYREFSDFFPENAVEYFVSYYDYYRPESYLPASDTYIEKDSSINDEIERMRLSATAAVMDRSDVLIVATVSCIFGLGDPKNYRDLVVLLRVGLEIKRKPFLKQLVTIGYERDSGDLARSSFRVRGDTIEIHPAYARYLIRVEFFGDTVEKITRREPVSSKWLGDLQRTPIYPARHYVTTKEQVTGGIVRIEKELQETLKRLKEEGKEVEAQRLRVRTEYDIELLREVGFCRGIENYSRQISDRKQGEAPACLLDYLPEGWLLFVDESHVTLPQLHAMYNGDQARKRTLVEHGFRLPSALDNRPLRFTEFENKINQAIYVSATPGVYERERPITEQIIRPTGLIDPSIKIQPIEGQVDHLMAEIKERAKRDERTLVTTLTKRMAEDLSQFFVESGIKSRYLHSQIETVERVEILRDLRSGIFDVVVGINLLREGLDLPEVSLVAILDADQVGFLRSASSLIQIIGRAARHISGSVIMYAEKISPAMRTAIDETERREKIQKAHNKAHNITPQSISKKIENILEREYDSPNKLSKKQKHTQQTTEELILNLSKKHKPEELKSILLEKMFNFSDNFEFEKAAVIRNYLSEINKKNL